MAAVDGLREMVVQLGQVLRYGIPNGTGFERYSPHDDTFTQGTQIHRSHARTDVPALATFTVAQSARRALCDREGSA